jgi:hypothetical protein
MSTYRRRDIMRLCAGMTVAGSLAGCAEKAEWASASQIASHTYRSNGPASLALVTNVSNRTNRGAHTALIIDGPERVVYNPAGTWRHPDSPERGDVHYNFSPEMEKWFIDYHARETYRVMIQRVEVPDEVAAMAYQRAINYGAVGPSRCTIASTRILHGLPGFENYPAVLFPDKAVRNFQKIPGVRTVVYVDDSPGDWSDFRTGIPDAAELQPVPEHEMARAIPRDLLVEVEEAN